MFPEVSAYMVNEPLNFAAGFKEFVYFFAGLWSLAAH
jgi:hypothetical protein